MRLSNIIAVLRDQMPLRRFIRNTLNGNIRGVLHKRSHTRQDGQAKVAYGSKETAVKSADAMSKKVNARFDTYKCLWCDGYHIGKHYTVNNGIQS